MELDQKKKKKSFSEHGPSCCKATARKKKKKQKVKRGNATATTGRDNATDRADTASQPDRTERVGASEERGTPTPAPPVFKGEIVRRNEAIDIVPERRLAANQDTIDVLPERRLAANHMERRPAAGNGLEQDGTAANTGVVVVTSSFTTPCTDARTKSSIVSASCGEEDTPVSKREESRAVDDIARSELVPVPLDDDDGLQVPDPEDARSNPEDARSCKKSAESRRRYREHAKARWFVLNAILLGEGGIVDTAWAVLRKRQKRRTLHFRGKKPLILGLLDSAKTAKENT